MIKPTYALLGAVALSLTLAGCSKSNDSSSTTAADASAAPNAASATHAGGMSMAGSPHGGDAAHGKAIFSANCASCHGANGIQGGVGPSLKGEAKRKNYAAAIAWIKNPQPPMPKLYPSPLSEKDVDDVAAYVEKL